MLAEDFSVELVAPGPLALLDTSLLGCWLDETGLFFAWALVSD